MRHNKDSEDSAIHRHSIACPFAVILSCLAWLILCGWSGHALGQEHSGNPPSASVVDQVALQQMREKAALLFRKKDWLAAAKAYDDVCKSDPDDAIAWYRRGYALHALEDDVRAMEAHERAAKVDSGKAKALYNLACALTLTNRSEEALDALERAAKAGFSDARLLKTDSDLASIRNHPRFVRLIEKVAENSSASDRPELRQFDFWVGDWDVFNAKGVKVGANKIELLLGGHLIQETWTSAKGG
ncbi:MAG: tetratricopeptide repeat protein, partial [Planctomycetes bacterium]|nr:tetratricopeptide repeat protein [Planctomycetota bacterium]